MPEVPAPPTADEPERLTALRAYQILDSGPEPAFDDLTELAARICGTPIALVSLVDRDRQWFKSRIGLEATETPRDLAFCAHAIHSPNHLFVVPDAPADARFSDNPLVTGPPDIRFYAGAPLVSACGRALGTLCVIDRVPRSLDENQQGALAALGRQVASQLELRLHLLQRDLVIRGLEELDGARQTFVATASHELRTPLTAITGALGLIEGGAAGSVEPEARELVRIASSNARRLGSLVNDLLDLSKLESGASDVAHTALVAKELVDACAAELATLALGRQVSLRIVAGPPLTLWGDHDQLLRVLRNLVANAVRFSPVGGEVTIGFDLAADGFVRVRVQDKGPGVAEVDQERLFLPFSQVGPGKGLEGTSGLGLAIVKSIVESHGGRVGIESELGQGAIFWFELPPRDRA